MNKTCQDSDLDQIKEPSPASGPAFFLLLLLVRSLAQPCYVECQGAQTHNDVHVPYSFCEMVFINQPIYWYLLYCSCQMVSQDGLLVYLS